MNRIKITAGRVTGYATLNDSPTAQAIWTALPITAEANTWGEEVYFAIPVEREEETEACEVVALGDLGYWPPGTAFCMFFGRTPVSRGDEIRAASPVNPIGKLEGDPKIWKAVRSGTEIVLEKAK